MALKPGARIYIGPTFLPANNPDLGTLRQLIHVATVVKNSSNSRFFPCITATIPNTDGPVAIDDCGQIVQFPSQINCMAEYFQIDTCITQHDGTFAFCSSAPRDDHELASTGIEKYYQLNIQSVNGNTPTIDDIQQLASELNIKLADPKPARTMRMG